MGVHAGTQVSGYYVLNLVHVLNQGDTRTLTKFSICTARRKFTRAVVIIACMLHGSGSGFIETAFNQLTGCA